MYDACGSEVHVSGYGPANSCGVRLCSQNCIYPQRGECWNFRTSCSVTEGVSFSCVIFVSQFRPYVSVIGLITRPSLITLIVTVEAAILRGTCNVTKL